ncbi:MAG: MBL fold metallo-hydrolase [Bacteroides sp.]|nr:MBL fold metallo-hydrolase [Bacteroidales bacterium]MBD5303738.1 MBL fold metallo-hydrolase [Bacteroides sp.]
MNIAKFEFSLFGINTYVVYDPKEKKAAIIDPGMINREEEEALTRFLERNSLEVTQIINTHLHIDHAIGAAFAKKRFKAPLFGHKEDAFLGERLQQQAIAFGINTDVEGISIDTYLEPGDKIKVGSGELEVLHVPGHSPGSIALYDREGGFVITGDALFEGSVGRTDLPGGNGTQLIQSIRENLLPLPDSTIVYPGHGPATTIGRERAANPFLAPNPHFRLK